MRTGAPIYPPYPKNIAISRTFTKRATLVTADRLGESQEHRILQRCSRLLKNTFVGPKATL